MDVRELTIKINSEADLKGFNKADKETSGLAGKITGLNAAFELAAKGAALLKQGIEYAVGHTIEYGAKIDDTSKRLGVQAEALQTLNYIAKQSGVSYEEVEKGLTRVSKGFTEALKTGAGPFVDTLELLNIKFKDVQRLKPEAIFELIGDKLSKISDEKIRTGLAMEVFGKTGANLLPMFEGGAAGMEKMSIEAYELGAVLEDHTIKAAAELDDNLNRVKIATQSIAFGIGGTLIPVIDRYVKVVINWWKANREVIQSKMEDYVSRVASAFEKTWQILEMVVPPLWEIYTAFQDIIQTAFGDFLDLIIPVLQKVADKARTLWGILKEIWPAVKNLVSVFGDLAVTLGGDVWDGFVKAAESVWNFTNALSALTPGGQIALAVFEKLRDLFKSFKETISGLTLDIDKVTSTLNGAAESITSWLPGASKELRSGLGVGAKTDPDAWMTGGSSVQPEETYEDAEAAMLAEESAQRTANFVKGLGTSLMTAAEDKLWSTKGSIAAMDDKELANLRGLTKDPKRRQVLNNILKKRAQKAAKADAALRGRFANMRNRGKGEEKEKEEDVDKEVMDLLEKATYGNSSEAKNKLRGKNVPKIDPSVAVQIANTNVYQTIDARVMVSAQPGEGSEQLATRIVSHRGDVFERKIRDALEYFTPVFVR